MKVLVTGIKGQLGYDVVKCLKKRNIDCVGAGREEFDITNENAVRTFILQYRPDVVIHCSAFTAVDRAEDEKELCYKVNVTGTANIAKVCKELSAVMVHVSTDYVFRGEGTNFYEVDDMTEPLSQYGITKLAGELEVKKYLDKYFIVRVSWVFGKNGNNFVKTMLRLGKEKEEVSVVCDQIGSPTYTLDLANLLCDMIMTDKYGTYHATNEGVCSWAEFAEAIFELSGSSAYVKHIPSKEFPTKAARPYNSRLSKKSLTDNGFDLLPPWKDALKRYLEELKEKEEE